MVFFSLILVVIGAVGFGLLITGNENLIPQIAAIPMVVWGGLMVAGVAGFLIFRRPGD